MYKRLLIINWKFNDGYSSEWDVDDLKDCKVFCCNTSTPGDFHNKISKLKSESTLILLHSNTPNQNVKLDNIQCSNNLGKIKKYIFQGGTGPIYVTTKTKLGLLFANGSSFDNNSKIKKNDKEYIKKENFEFVWDWYWNKLDLENHKKNIINLWLPLAIDIQGLSEVKDNQEKSNKYFTEINKENGYLNLLSSFSKEEDFPRWDEIKSTLSTDYKNFNPTELVSAIISAQDFNSFKLNDKQYLESKIGDNPNPNFLPNWLQEVVTIINKKINESA